MEATLAPVSSASAGMAAAAAANTHVFAAAYATADSVVASLRTCAFRPHRHSDCFSIAGHTGFSSMAQRSRHRLNMTGSNSSIATGASLRLGLVLSTTEL